MPGSTQHEEFYRLRAEYLKLKSALHDPNTELVSYHAHFAELRSRFDQVRRIGILAVGLGDLSRVESIYGWQVCDRILRQVAGALRSLEKELLPSGSILALDGVAADQFVIFIPADRDGKEVTSSFLEALLGSLGSGLDEVFAGEVFRSMTVRPRFELGYSLLVDDPFYRFERLVYAAVERARHRRQAETERIQSRNEDELRRILHEGAIRMLFQPIHSLANGTVLGYEALSRGPRDGPFEDARALFDASLTFGLSTELDCLCQRQALREAHDLERGRKLFLNALPTTFLDPSGGAHLPLEWIDRAGLERSDVIIEISERGPLKDRARFGEEVRRLRAAGVGLALDDIGTGLTGLQAIEELRPDYLKLDVSLVRNIHTNLITQDLLRSLTRVAQSIGARVVGEGVETEEELQALRDCGTHFAQGFLFSRPMPGFAPVL